MNANQELSDAWRADLSRELEFRASLDGTLIETNSNVSEVLGWSSATLRGKTFFDLVHPDEILETHHEWQRAASGVSAAQFRVKHQCEDGSSRWITWRVIVGGDTMYALGQNTTIEAETQQELQRCREDLARLEELETMVRLGAGLRHEFNNLFQTTLGALQLVQRLIAANRVSETAHFLEGAVRASRNAANLNQKLAALSRVAPRSRTWFEVTEWVADVAGVLRCALPSSVSLVETLGADAGKICCDRREAQLAVIELVLAAGEMAEGSGTIVITTSHHHASVSNVGGSAVDEFVILQVALRVNSADSMTSPLGEAPQPAQTAERIEMRLPLARRFARDNGGILTVDIDDVGRPVMTLHLPVDSRRAAEHGAEPRAKPNGRA